LAKVIGEKGTKAEDTANLLRNLYDLRSKVVHGSDYARQHRKIEPHLASLRRISRIVLTKYVLFMSEHSQDDWKKHLNSLLFA